MQKVITQLAVLRSGVQRFEKQVNRHLSEGWTAETVSVTKGGLRIVCVAVLEKTVPILSGTEGVGAVSSRVSL